MTYSGIRKATEVFTNINVTGSNTGIRATGDILVDAGGKGDYTTVAAALAAATPGSGHITINPGTYIENNPLTVPDGVYLEGRGYATEIRAQNAGEHLFIAGASVVFHNLFFTGSTGVGKACIYYAGGITYNFTLVRNCLFLNAYYGCLSETGPGELVCREVGIVTSATQTVTTGFVAQNGGLMRCYIAAVQGNPAQRPVIGYYVTGSSKMELALADAVDCVTGINNNNGGDLNISNVEMRDCDVSILLNGASTTSDTRMFSARSIDSNTWDLNIDITGANVLSGAGCDFLAEKVNNPNTVPYIITFISNRAGDRAYVIQGELSVGSHNRPTATAMGGGDSHIFGMSVFTNTNEEAGTWADITASYSDSTSSAALFPALTVGSSVYIGSSSVFPGIEYVMSTGLVPGSGAITAEYWNGASWATLLVMITGASSPYYSYNGETFQRAATEHARFGQTTSWATKNLNGTTRYWVRFRVITAAITSNATGSLIKIHTNHSKMNIDGFLEYFGNCRPVHKIPWDQNIIRSFGSSPADLDVFYSDNLAAGRVENHFETAVLDRIGFNTPLPLEIDTSYPIKFSLIYGATTAANYVYVVRWGRSSPGDDVHTSTGTAPTTGATEQNTGGTLTVTAPNAGKQQKITFDLDISTFNARRSDGTTDLLWVSFERTGTDGGDTGGSFIVLQVAAYYVAWCDGGHIGAYSQL